LSDQPGFLSRLFITGSLAFVLIGILGALYGVSLPAFTRLYGLDEGAASFILTTNALGAMVAVTAATLGFPGLGARTALALMAIGAAIIALTPGWSLTLVGSSVIGAGFGLIATEVNRSFLSGFGTRGPGMVGLVNGISGGGLIVGPILYVWTGGNVAVLYGGAALFSAALVFSYVRTAPAQRTQGRGSFRTWRVGVLALNLLAASIEAALGGLAVTALIASGWTETGAATLAAAFFAAFLIGRVALYWINRHVAPDVLYLVGAIGTAISAGLAAMGFHAIGFTMSGAFVGLFFPAFFVWGARLLGDDPRMSSAMLLSGLTGLAIGPFVVSLILDRIGFDQLFLLVAIGSALLTLIILVAMPPARRALARAVPAATPA
jgi:fucose permease